MNIQTIREYCLPNLDTELDFLLNFSSDDFFLTDLNKFIEQIETDFTSVLTSMKEEWESRFNDLNDEHDTLSENIYEIYEKIMDNNPVGESSPKISLQKLKNEPIRILEWCSNHVNTNREQLPIEHLVEISILQSKLREIGIDFESLKEKKLEFLKCSKYSIFKYIKKDILVDFDKWKKANLRFFHNDFSEFYQMMYKHNEKIDKTRINNKLTKTDYFSFLLDPSFLTNQSNPSDFNIFRIVTEKILVRIVHHIKQKLSATIFISDVLHRFKQRAEWYDHERLRKLAEYGNYKIKEEPEKKPNSKRKYTPREKRLQYELCRYLFDNGLIPLYEVEVGGKRLDILSLNKKNLITEVNNDEDFTQHLKKQYKIITKEEIKMPLLIETKVCMKGSSPRTWLKEGIRQCFDYLHRTNYDLNLKTIYLVYFRLSGPYIVLPDIIEIKEEEEKDDKNKTRFSIIPFLIDIGKKTKKDKGDIILDEREIIYIPKTDVIKEWKEYETEKKKINQQ